MRFFFRLLIIQLFIGLSINAKAQENCKALLPAIADKYEGECNKGKASGLGKASGEDKYEGNFKNGLPDGKGVYTWKNGKIYDGQWVKGKMEGKGRLSYPRNGRPDSIVTGFWKKDIYIGEYEKPFIVHESSSEVSKIDVRLTGKAETYNSLIVKVTNTTGGTISQFSVVMPPPELTDISIQSGSFRSKENLFISNKGIAIRLVDTTYPFRARFQIGTQFADVEILEKGSWTIDILLRN